jgi:hypothetical protein
LLELACSYCYIITHIRDTIENPKYDRESINGLRPFFDDKAPEDIKGFYSKDELAALLALKGTERDVEDRMPV